jgi:hypothetical protein|tara:strand:- start:508 stop:1464 length:957 start_codon:yes stop_codon:yes gene_type:complete
MNEEIEAVVEDTVVEPGALEVDVEGDDFEVEIADDTPEEDKGRPRRAADAEADIPEDEELEKHSESVQKRIKKLKFEFHEERRRKEEAEREREAAVQYAESQKNEATRLRKNLSEGEGVLVNEAKARVASELNSAKRAYKEAYEAGDTDAVLEAQMSLSKLQLEADRVENWKPAQRVVQDQSETPAPQAAPRVPRPDRKAQEWVAENDWFQKDTGMTRYAMLIHEELLETGVDSTSDVYYSKINEAMRSRYPDRFADVEPEVRQPQRKAGSVVAPGGRNTASSRNKVVITSSEAAIAKRLGLSNKEYAAQKLKDMQNG